MYRPVAPTRPGKIWPLAAVCCLGLVLFLIAATIVLALIPIYLPHKDVTTPTAPNDNNTLYLQYSTGANADNGVSGAMENKAELATLLNLGDEVEVAEAYSQATFQRRRRGVSHQRDKRTLKLLLLIILRLKFKATCTDSVCQIAVRTRIQTRVKQIGNIASFPCSIRSAGALYSFTTSVTYIGIIPSSGARLGFGVVTSLTFVAVRNGPFNDPTTWSGGIIPFGLCSVVIPASITVTLERTVLEIKMKTIEIYGALSVGSGNSPFKFNYAVNIIVRSGGSITFLTSTPTLLMPPSSIVTVHTGGSFSATGVIIQTYTTAGLGKSATLSSPNGPLTCGILASGVILSFTRITYIVIQSGSITSEASFLGGSAATTDSCNTYGCGLYIPAGYTLSTSDLGGVLNIRLDVIYVVSGGTLQLGASGSSAGFRFKYAVQLDIYGTLGFLGASGSGIYIPTGSSVNFYSGGSFISEVVTFLQVYDPSTNANIGDALVLQISFSGPYYITISSTGVISISTTTPGGSDSTTSSNGLTGSSVTTNSNGLTGSSITTNSNGLTGSSVTTNSPSSTVAVTGSNTTLTTSTSTSTPSTPTSTPTPSTPTPSTPTSPSTTSTNAPTVAME